MLLSQKENFVLGLIYFAKNLRFVKHSFQLNTLIYITYFYYLKKSNFRNK